MAIDFPASPAVGQRYAYNGINYIFTAQGIWSVTSTGIATSTSKITVQKFTTVGAGTYTPTPGTQFAIVECVGAGGGGGGVAGTAGSNYFIGGGGGSGGYSRSYLTAAQIGASQSITIGAGGAGGLAGNNVGSSGGDTSFGGLCIAKGGGGGCSPVNTPAPGGGQPGAGGLAGTGDITANGAPGEAGQYVVGVAGLSAAGGGGSSIFGGGAGGVYSPGANVPGTAGQNYGSGGSAAASFGAAGNIAGGAGSAGICIVTEYNIAAAGPQGPTGPMGGTTGVSTPGGRLTYDPNKPVMTSSTSTTLQMYYLPYIGDRVPIFDGTSMVMTSIPSSGLSCALTDTVKNPNAIGSLKINDWYVWNDAGTVRLGHGPDWSSDTSRAPNTANPVMVNGILTNAAVINNGPTINKGTYVGTTRSNNVNNYDWVYGTFAAPPVAGSFSVWNAYNRVRVSTQLGDTTTSWTYASTFRQVRAQTSNKVEFVVGLASESIDATHTVVINFSNTNGLGAVGLDSFTASSGTIVYIGAAVAGTMTGSAQYAGTPAIGWHSLAPLEATVSGQTVTYFGSSLGAQSGFTFNMMA